MTVENSGNPDFRRAFYRDPKGIVKTFLQLWTLLMYWPEHKPKQNDRSTRVQYTCGDTVM